MQYNYVMSPKPMVLEECWRNAISKQKYVKFAHFASFSADYGGESLICIWACHERYELGLQIQGLLKNHFTRNKAKTSDQWLFPKKLVK